MSNCSYHDYRLVLRMLGIALVEIRSTSSLGTAQALADIFHNVPGQIANRKDAEFILTLVVQCAERYDMLDYIKTLRLNSEIWISNAELKH